MTQVIYMCIFKNCEIFSPKTFDTFPIFWPCRLWIFRNIFAVIIVVRHVHYNADIFGILKSQNYTDLSHPEWMNLTKSSFSCFGGYLPSESNFEKRYSLVSTASKPYFMTPRTSKSELGK
jgi:hypothetical protein